ncbi:restriction endonuclease subunit S [Enterococcus faecalis]|uniref:restriction endonuclease subunit S n=1 Tax=Enterococcus faecalis TaxID=1351 RepID=UPI000CF62D23|nr:restriction endonuclease subunit S [Enterococcus faecalis]EGO6538893.1 restriction endonuclease subunit S [Enterococcus faecalis]EGO8961718.1 restriction endonuclease subunit S [Enterococcus faecalis]EIR3947250.1 restriction endonuclease subunit S [Enterococcus faecalis]MCD4912468.1 restriction endonuclease subunit S [Enterococcus faecalis]NSN14894.1 restriction endonuclease subunit S [Enterococcus faecalis]
MIVFTLIGVWELCKLGRVVERVTRKNKELKSTLPLTISAQEGLIDQNVFFNKSVASRDVSGYYLIYNGEFAYNKSYSNGYPWGAIKRLNRYDMGVLSTLYIIFKPKNIDSNFLEKYYDTSCWYHEVSKHAAEGARNHGLLNIAASDFLRTELTVPKSVEEQRKIGNFLKQLDDTITLHQRKLEQLKELKKAYLQLMFPKKDETVPRVRFADFEDDWQLCKLGDVVEIFDGTHQTPRYTDSGVKFVSVENIATLETKKYITHEAYEKEYSKKRAKKGDILMTRIGDIGTMKVIETDEPLAYYVTLALLKAKETNPYFLSFIISSPEIQRNIWKRTLHIAFPKKINLGEINQVEMKITIFEEQDKIGDLFTNLDDAIILNQNKLNQLKSLKKSYLQNMFI